MRHLRAIYNYKYIDDDHTDYFISVWFVSEDFNIEVLCYQEYRCKNLEKMKEKLSKYIKEKFNNDSPIDYFCLGKSSNKINL